MKHLFLFAMLLLATASFSQQLTYKSGGRIYNSNMDEMNAKEMRALLASKPGLLNYYNSGQSKKNIGGFALGFGGGLMIGDLVVALTTTSEYPSIGTYIGAGTALASIPIMSGYSKKLKKVVDDYNKEVAGIEPRNGIDEFAIVASKNGTGIRITF
ncbi:MAG TPA: hypothetical protein VF581_03740 [Flavobacterium sp.]|jgi:hypothetical protein